MSPKTSIIILAILTFILAFLGVYIYFAQHPLPPPLKIQEYQPGRQPGTGTGTDIIKPEPLSSQEKKEIIINRLEDLRAGREQAASTGGEMTEQEKKQEIINRLDQLRESSEEEVEGAKIYIYDKKAEEEEKKQEILDRLEKLRKGKNATAP